MIRGVFVLLLLAATALAGGYEKLSPFTGVRWEGETPEVEFEGAWYRPESIAGKPVADILTFAKRRWSGKWRKRFAEDLVEVLSEMGAPPGRKVDLVLVAKDSGKRVTRKGAPMTEENRNRVWRAAAAAERTAAPPAALTEDEAAADLAALRRHMESHHSYLRLREVDLDRAFEFARTGIRGKVGRDEFSRRVRGLLARFGDGHTRVTDPLTRDLPRGYLPFLLEDVEGGVVAFRADRSELLDPDLPYVRTLDGLPLDDWVKAAGVVVAKGSPQFVRRHSLRNLRYFYWLRSRLGREQTAHVTVTFTDAAGGRTRESLYGLVLRKPNYGEWPRAKSRRIGDDVGYLRIASMDDDPAFLAGLRASMKDFADTNGLVIDVRGNGGGTRDALRAILPWLLSKKDSPRIVNVAKYRIPPGEELGGADAREGYLDNRFLYPLASTRWTKADRSAIRRFATAFRPEWTPPGSDFSDWHYMLVNRGDGPRYAKPVVVLMDGGCFSATDIFLGALKGLPKVTLIGTPSGGGSGRSRSFVLPVSRLRVRVSSMASFRPDGKLYDGRGIEPDVVVRPKATDLVGESDSVLDAALRRLR
jgi:hypothetical protein